MCENVTLIQSTSDCFSEMRRDDMRRDDVTMQLFVHDTTTKNAQQKKVYPVALNNNKKAKHKYEIIENKNANDGWHVVLTLHCSNSFNDKITKSRKKREFGKNAMYIYAKLR